jgi:hypothetical protein
MSKVIAYKGKMLDEMSKEELIAVVQFAVEETESNRDEYIRQREFLSSLRRQT